MNKKKLTAIFGMMLLLFMVNTVVSAEKEVVKDTFEEYKVGDQNVEGWNISPNVKADGNYAEIAQDPLNSQNKVLKLQSGAQTVNAVREFEDIGGIVTIEFKVNFQQATIHHLCDISGVLMNMPYQGQFCINSGAKSGWPVPNVGVEYNRWYDMVYKIDFAEKTFSIECDGIIFVSGEPFMSVDTESIKTITFNDGGNTMYIDDVQISYSGNIVKNYLKLASDVYKVNANYKQISNIRYETTVDEFLSNLTFVQGALYEIRTSEEEPYTGKYLEDNLILNITSPIIDSEIDFLIRVRPWVASRETIMLVSDSVTFSAYENCHIAKGEKKDNGIQYIDGIRYFPLRAVCKGFDIPIEYDSVSKVVYVNSQPLNSGIILNDITYVDEDVIKNLLNKVIVYDDNGICVIKNEQQDVNELVGNIIADEIHKRMRGE